MILPGFGLSSQLSLRSSRVLVIGAGGLGCPAIQYLSSCGVGYISVVDHDVVERSNLSRQILHTDQTIGQPKVKSVQTAIARINPFVVINPVQAAFSVHNALELVKAHDLVLDCTDNPLTRYLVNDAAVLCGKPLVSGAGQGYDGQLVILNKAIDGISRGPCYRCLFPVAPKPSEVKDCAETGVLGVITGIIGTLQASEAIKLLTGLGAETFSDEQDSTPPRQTMLLISLLEPSQQFRTIKIRPRRPNCRVCGAESTLREQGINRITVENIKQEDYLSFCGLKLPSNPDSTQNNSLTKQTTVKELADAGTAPRLLLDVRTKEEFSIVRLEGSINLPYSDIRANPHHALQDIRAILKQQRPGPDTSSQVHVLCLKGNDSLLAADALNGLNSSTDAQAEGESIEFIDVKGGLREWKKVVDIDLPEY